MIELKNNQLMFSFAEVHSDARFRIEFQRTLRIPDDNRDYPLPPGLGRFPLLHVDDFEATVPASWRAHGGVFLPMYQSEALWLNFSGAYPMAIKVAAGKVDAITGEAWRDELTAKPQDYLVSPTQPWLDGFCVDEGLIRQFVAMPLGEGYSAEEQITGAGEHGGVQIIAYPMRAEFYERYRRTVRSVSSGVEYAATCLSVDSLDMDMGLAPGGLMRQQIYDDPHGIEAWDLEHASRCFVHLANSLAYRAITGQAPPTRAPTAEQYTRAGLPWFEYYDAETKTLRGSGKLAGLDSVAAKLIKQGKGAMPDNKPVDPQHLKQLGPAAGVVREGKF